MKQDGLGRFVLTEGFCGTTACVLGTAALLPEFVAAGLHVVFRHYTPSGSATAATPRDYFYHPAEGGKVSFADVKYGAKTGDSAGAAFFDIPHHHAGCMFYTGEGSNFFYHRGWDETITPKDVAKALRMYVATDGDSLEWAVAEGEADTRQPGDARYPRRRMQKAAAARCARLHGEAPPEAAPETEAA